ncbi:hypothetical protein NP552_18825 [Pseudomonas sp. 8209]|uniref:hypothetical protein n=1 Tax=Pseudomonas sp. 8209 TaxID=2967214 RepID=UPI0023632DD5|nr:hypothetical protein [Pseudomonas sp. 8209]MDD1957095.1 hypothetical protein [Pseudomonas sp. 8209]
MSNEEANELGQGSSPVGRGGAGAYIEGELGAFYLLSLLAGIEPRGLPGSRIQRVRFQGTELGYSLDDLVVHGLSDAGETLLEIQSKRTITFSPKDTVFKDVCSQIARSSGHGIPETQHQLAVATQRTSRAISGPYQDVLQWARTADSGTEFFRRLSAKGVAGSEMRRFGETFRANLVEAGVPDDDSILWGFLRRFLIMEFDFESGAPLTRTYALSIARHVLAPEDGALVEALWANLIQISLEKAKTGAAIARDELRGVLVDRGFHFTGDRDFSAARKRLAEMSRQAISEIGNTVAGVRLSRQRAAEALDDALDHHRYVEIRGGPGVGKSAVLRQLAERISGEANVLVLDPVGTPEGGWPAYSQWLGIHATAGEFLTDLAASGSGVLLIDSLEMFTTPGRRRTVNDLLREVAAINGFLVVTTARPDFGIDGDNWLASEALSALGPSQTVVVSELDDMEVEILGEQTPELRALLAPGHAATAIARNLYRLSRLLKVPSSTSIRTEAALANDWWRTADHAEMVDRRASQRLIADLADAALAGDDVIESRDDTPARIHLLRSQTLVEPRRDHLNFYHDVLRDWAVGARVHEDYAAIGRLDLAAPVSAKIARGIEFAGRLSLELTQDGNQWLDLLAVLSPAGSHSSWRRQALLAIMRSELSAALLQRSSAELLINNGELLLELCTVIAAVETVSPADLARELSGDVTVATASLPKSIRIAATASPAKLLNWCVAHSEEIPIQAIGAVVRLVQTLLPYFSSRSTTAASVAGMLFSWLRQLDEPEACATIPGRDPNFFGQEYMRMLADLRMMSLLLSVHAPEQIKAYLRALIKEKDSYKVKDIRPLSAAIAPVAPKEFAKLIEASLLEETGRRNSGMRREGALSFADSDYLPPSPAQPPFLDLLGATPEVGLDLVRRLVDEAITFHYGDRNPGTDGFTIAFVDGPRFFPWERTYFWSRDQASEYSVASALMALEAWGHDRIKSGDSLESVINDILGPDGGCAAYLLVAVDIMLSHWPASRELLVPLAGCPELLATERGRTLHDKLTGLLVGTEPAGRVRLADLQSKPSRRIVLENCLPKYLGEDTASVRLRGLLKAAVARLGAYSDHADFGDPAFMGVYALSLLNLENWIETEGRRQYRLPAAEEEHLAHLHRNREIHLRASEIEAEIQLAVDDVTRGSTRLAREAAEFAAGKLPDFDTDTLKSRSTQLAATALLVARDGDDELLGHYENWVRDVVAMTLAQDEGLPHRSTASIAYNRQALVVLALIHLWQRCGQKVDRNLLIESAARRDCCSVAALSLVLDSIIQEDPWLLKSVLRVALKASRWRWGPWNEDEVEKQAYTQTKDKGDKLAVVAEIAWLDGGKEPLWPTFPDEEPHIRHAPKIRVKDEQEFDRPHPEPMASVHVDSQAAGLWLSLLTDRKLPAWYAELVLAYSNWSAKMNGCGQPLEAEIDRAPTEWNEQFYILVAHQLMEADASRFDDLLKLVEQLPDRSFSDVSEVLIHAVDVWYFNSTSRSHIRPLELRERLVNRTITLRRWLRTLRPGDLSADIDTGGMIAKLLMNTHSPFSGTRSYLVPAVFDRIDPILDTLRPLLTGGPTPFVALCTMNTLSVAYRARHLDLVLFAAESWLDRLPTDTGMWIELGIGRKIVEWFVAAIAEQPSLCEWKHPMRRRIDALIGRLIGLGVPGAYELEQQVKRP